MKSTLKKTEKGITLVALVVTIVVLLILAGVSINLVLGNNGIIAKAKEAETKSAEASQNDLKGINALTEEMNNALGEKPKVDLSKYKIGDYVNYTYDTVSSGYTTPSTENGYRNQTIAQSTETLKWRILNIDEANGTVDLVSATPTSNAVGFGEILGYNNGPYIMDKICEALYSNNSRGIKARSIDLLDMEKHLTSDGITARNGSSSTVKYGKTKTYASNTKYPSLYAGQKGAGVNVAETEVETKMEKIDITKGNDPYEESKAIAETEPTKDSKFETGKPLTVTSTYYGISINGTNYGIAGDVMKSDNYFWVASRCVYADSDYASFGLRRAFTNMENVGMYISNGYVGSSYGNLRPVVSLPSSILSDTKDAASEAWNLK